MLTALPIPLAGYGLANAIGRRAIYALYTELALYPKPGLVSFVDNGAHRDMDSTTFMRSIAALRRYFHECALAGSRQASFDELRNLGLAAEERMKRATHGPNTHRGAIFSIGLLAAAAGLLLAQGSSLCNNTLGATVAKYWGNDIQTGWAQAPTSNGTKATQRYGVGGARRQATAGFPLLFDLAVPVMESTLRATQDRERAYIQTLFVLMAHLDDTNLLHRAGAHGLVYLQYQARAFLDAGGVYSQHWHIRAMQLHRECIARHLSPGGSADLLAAAIFVSRLRTAP